MNTNRQRLSSSLVAVSLSMIILFLIRFNVRFDLGHARAAAAQATPAPLGAPGPRPHFKTSGAVGAPATFQLAHPIQSVQAAALRSADDWTPALEEGFESGLDAGRWQVIDQSDDGFEYTWGVDDFQVSSGAQAVWVAAGGADAPSALAQHQYPPNMDAWLVLQTPIDLTGVQTADVEFQMLVETEPQYDYVFVGVSTDGANFSGQYWTGDSGGWQYYNLDLAEYLGYPAVYVGWYFHSDVDNADGEHGGVWVDDITVWTYQDSGPPQSDQLVSNGSFESGDFSGWDRPSGSTVIVTDIFSPAADGDYVAWFGGIDNANEQLSQAVTLPADEQVASAQLAFWVNQFGEESEPDHDSFCVWLAPQNDLGAKLLDLGCMDGVGAFLNTYSPDAWWQVNYPLSAEEWNTVKGQTVHLVFTMRTNEALDTTYLVDNVSIAVVTGGDPGDAYEPNDTISTATEITAGTPISNVTISPSQDVDVFRTSASVGDTVVVDIDAAVNGSRLDSVVSVVASDGTALCTNDDDGFTFDSYLTCEVSGSGPFFVTVRSYDGSGDRNSFYTLKVEISGSGTATPPPPTPVVTPTPTTTPEPGASRSWTAMLYIDGDNNLCGSYPGLVTSMENQLGAKLGASGFLNVAVLLDRDPRYCNGQGATTRYLVQPNGAYTDNVNRWEMGELNMGDPATLVNFARWAMQNYPADHYYLAIDNHGGGVSGIAWDDTNDHDNLSNAELYTALKQITENGTRKLDIFAYEACLMGMFENAFDISAFTSYIYFWPTISFTANTYPTYLGDARFTATTGARQFGEIMFDGYYNNVTNPYVLSLVDTSGLPALHQAVEAWANALVGQVVGSKQAMTEARAAAQKIDADANDQLTVNDYYIDLWDLADKLAQRGFAVAEANTLKSAIEATLVRTNQRSGGGLNYANAHGLSIYWPQTPIGDYAFYTDNRIYQEQTTAAWRTFLTTYFGAARGIAGGTLGPIERQPGEAEVNTLYLPLVQQE
jgi:hypothetical protein